MFYFQINKSLLFLDYPLHLASYKDTNVSYKLYLMQYDLKEDLNVYILDTCVGTCYEDWNTKKTGASAEAFIIQAMPPGIYNVIIDTYVSGKESTFKIRLDCSKTSNPCFDIKVPKGLSYISSPIKPTDPAIDFLLPDAKFNGKIDVITNDKMISYAPGFTSLPSSSALSKCNVEIISL